MLKASQFGDAPISSLLSSNKSTGIWKYQALTLRVLAQADDLTLISQKQSGEDRASLFEVRPDDLAARIIVVTQGVTITDIAITPKAAKTRYFARGAHLDLTIAPRSVNFATLSRSGYEDDEDWSIAANTALTIAIAAALRSIVSLSYYTDPNTENKHFNIVAHASDSIDGVWEATTVGIVRAAIRRLGSLRDRSRGSDLHWSLNVNQESSIDFANHASRCLVRHERVERIEWRDV